MRRSIMMMAACLLAGTPALAENACMDGNMAEFGRYVGDWTVTDASLMRDGAGWSDGLGGRWVFECIDEGAAVQDFWIPRSGGWGTDLRTFNPDTGTWEIVWAATGQKGLMHIEARQEEDGRIVMNIVKPAQVPLRRIIRIVGQRSPKQPHTDL